MIKSLPITFIHQHTLNPPPFLSPQINPPLSPLNFPPSPYQFPLSFPPQCPHPAPFTLTPFQISPFFLLCIFPLPPSLQITPSLFLFKFLPYSSYLISPSSPLNFPSLLPLISPSLFPPNFPSTISLYFPTLFPFKINQSSHYFSFNFLLPHSP